MNADVPRKSPTVVFKPMEEGGVLFCSRTEVYFGLNEVGVVIWDLLPDPRSSGSGTIDPILDSLERKYPDAGRDALAADVRAFLEELERNELVAHVRLEAD